jgi:hypothetical protein
MGSAARAPPIPVARHTRETGTHAPTKRRIFFPFSLAIESTESNCGAGKAERSARGKKNFLTTRPKSSACIDLFSPLNFLVFRFFSSFSCS